MSVEVLVGQNIFRSNAQTLVNAVNTVGVMGKGLAKKFADRFPDMLADYERRCAEMTFRIGQPYVYKDSGRPWILNFPTKEHWRANSDLAPILEGITFLGEHLKAWEVDSLAVPPLGCGHGGLEWRVVGPVYVRRFDELGIPVFLYAPFEDPSVVGTSGALSLFDADEVAPPRTLVPLIWITIAASMRTRGEGVSVSRAGLAELGRAAMLREFDSGLFMDDEQPSNVRGFSTLVTKLLSNGLFVEHRQGRRIAYAPGPAAIPRDVDSLQTRQEIDGLVAEVLERSASASETD